MAVIIIERTADLGGLIVPEGLRGGLYANEAVAHRFVIHATRGGEPVTLDGQVVATFIRADGGTEELTGGIDDGAAVVTLPQSCYAVPGRFALTIFNNGTDGSTTAVYSCVGNVINTTTDTIIDPGSVVPTMTDITAAYNAAQAALATANAAAGATSGALVGFGPYAAGYDIIGLLPKTTATHNGITYTWDGAGRCKLTGTLTSFSVNNLWSQGNLLPPGMEPGMTFKVTRKSSASPSQVKWQIRWYKSSGEDTDNPVYPEDGELLTVPSYATGVRIRLIVEEADPMPSFGDNPGELLTIGLTRDYTYKPRGVLADQTNLDTVTTAGYYLLTSSRTYINAPISGALTYPRELEVLPVTNNTILQRVTDPYAAITYTRVYQGAIPSWAAWIASPTQAAVDAVDAKADAAYQPRGILTGGTDLDNVTTEGNYQLPGTLTFLHSPWTTPREYPTQLEVIKNASGRILQRITDATANRQYVRQGPSVGALVGSTWAEAWTQVTNTYTNNVTTQAYSNSYTISCSPTITTEANNYLPATGDTTDRTGDIQTMLNTTGICRLGPGDFYVTGVELPTYGMLIGSGAKTRVILAASVTSGYAVKLGNYSCAKDMRIVGATSSYTPVEAVGTRHGVTFEATATASSPTYKYSATVENLWILDFAGAGIMCSATGQQVDQSLIATDCHIKRCDAGIYIPILSEFHHFTNMNVTHCYHGVICNGGNCLFTNCNFSRDIIGVEIGSTQNNAHGVFSACKIAHSGANNDGVALKVDGSELCENFNGISFDYGQIVVTGSKGLMFNGCRLGRGVSIDVTGSQAIIFNACIIRDPSQIDHVTSTNSTTRFVACYDSLTGAEYNPLA